ncbi:MAG: septum formation initiator family protein [Dysgonamonadaceae bacterium]|jgi:cell division protein FtsB|nr:septum formation initiator family protein [Dysgonamonadaceae bacterium]MDD3309553.1 septum formation initiator family protein [Dysgonamonadaceae bacterium]MDD3900350.1 septum formation initiator family protein [Dysgonamonadaceae bacterium]MDD4399032.1 septum formation initiator family protein [Dysgonamonadaceae bacterium]MEA5082380.1 septum formation initiator family protein [Dysgonamonadaceae bacterium]
MLQNEKEKNNRILGLTKVQIIIVMVLMAILFLFSDSGIPQKIKYENQINSLKNQIDFFQNQTAKDKKKLEELQSDDSNLEKYARENYRMKKANEDIFVIEE